MLSASPVNEASPLVKVAACPACRQAGGVRFVPHPVCKACGWAGRLDRGVPDFVDETRLHEGHYEEVAAQTRAVEDYYENELRLTCHWDRLSADGLAEWLGSPSGLALDLGCGTGTAGGGLVRSGMTVIGADLSIPCLEVAARRLNAVARVDAAHLPFADASFDAVVSRGALHHLDDPHAALAELARVMKPGARALFMDPREYAWLEPIKHALRKNDASFTHEHHAFGVPEYQALIGEHLRVERTETQYALAILVAHSLDLLPLPARIPRRPLAQLLLGVDRRLDRTPLKRVGHLLVVVAKKDG